MSDAKADRQSRRPIVKLSKHSAEALLQYIEVAATQEHARTPAGPYHRGDVHSSVLAGLTGVLEYYARRETSLFKIQPSDVTGDGSDGPTP